jgi:hypothetical protein
MHSQSALRVSANLIRSEAALCSERSAPFPKAVVLVVSITCSSLVLLTFMQAGSQTA